MRSLSSAMRPALDDFDEPLLLLRQVPFRLKQ